MSSAEVACSYASLILHDDGITVTVRFRSILRISFPRKSVWGVANPAHCILLIGKWPKWQAEKIATLVKTANVPVDSYWPSLLAKLAEKRSIEDLVLNVGSGGGAAPVAAATPSGAAAAAAASAAEEKKVHSNIHIPDSLLFDSSV